ncbi:methyltransferase domain-containing protein [Iocasia frigidifontis]|uniref:Methyltransferase domain-containing protein n=2 Tax=Iocasia fonsfrigidae TaxID=2682810 RepID=A0A8A7K9B2_9FIRM|nr:methyltransferase domain-containing protein [Iocasia fonsfrigidae]
MLNKIRDKFGDKGDIECRGGKFEELPIEGESVDYVFANMFLHHVSSPTNTDLC